jgi:hypothetical protein
VLIHILYKNKIRVTYYGCSGEGLLGRVSGQGFLLVQLPKVAETPLEGRSLTGISTKHRGKVVKAHPRLKHAIAVLRGKAT